MNAGTWTAVAIGIAVAVLVAYGYFGELIVTIGSSTL